MAFSSFRRKKVKKLHTRRGGFTLIELMIVVAIIGILAAIAIPNFLRFQLKAKSSEGKANLAAIRTAEESFFAEYGTYVSAAATPAAAPDNTKQIFTTGGVADFGTLGWSPEGRVYFNYAIAMNGGGTLYNASASADIDNDSTSQTWGYRKGTQAGVTHPGGGACSNAEPSDSNTVAPCQTASGQSIF